jgi:hypothetical protein
MSATNHVAPKVWKLAVLPLDAPSGTEVLVAEDDQTITLTRTRSETWKLGSGDHVVLLEGRTGGYSVERLFLPPAWQIRNDWIGEMREHMRTQDNRCTKDPVFLVQQRKRHYGLDPQWSDDVVWLDDEGHEVTDKAELDRIEAAYQNEGWEEPDGYTRTAYIDQWEFVQAFFTEHEAQRYIDANRHRMCDPRIYVDSAYRNREWQRVSALLMG